MKPFRPQKAPSESIRLDQLVYPMLASYKLDGIRCTIIDGEPRSTSNKPLPTAWARLHYCAPQFEGVDGELVIKNPTPGKVYTESMSAVMTKGDMTPLVFHVFDILDSGPYAMRLFVLRQVYSGRPNVNVIEQRHISNEAELLAFEKEALDAGHEGVMIRSLDRYYKQGRCTLKEYNIFKFVRHMTGEFRITGFYEQMENTNEKVIAETGLSKRSTHQANKIGKGTLGGFHCEETKTGVAFDIGTGDGLDRVLRDDIWQNQSKYITRIGKYKSKPYGVKDKPRQPIWIGWRDPLDIEDEL